MGDRGFATWKRFALAGNPKAERPDVHDYLRGAKIKDSGLIRKESRCKMDHINTLKASVVAFFGALTAAFGWFGWLVIMFFLCMVIDYLTGTAAAMQKGEWSSAVARAGLWHKCGSLIAVIVSGLADIVVGLVVNNIPAITLPFDYTVLICPIVVVWYILTELGSITENAGALGAPVPKFLKQMIKVFKDVTDATGDKLSSDGRDDQEDIGQE